MSAELPDFDDDTPLSTRYLYPGDWWGSDDGMTEEDHGYLAILDMGEADKVAITDNDADGLGSMAVIAEAFPDETIAHIESGHGQSGMSPEKAIEVVAEYSPGGMDVFITDICLDEEDIDEIVDSLARISEKSTVYVWDHHEWSDESKARVSEVVEELFIAEDEEWCATDIAFQKLEDAYDENNPDAHDQMEELAAVTRDHDLWIKENPISDDLGDYAFWAEIDEYLRAVRNHGAQITDDTDVSQRLEEEREEKENRIQLAVKNAEWYDIEGYTVAVTYGNVYASETGNRLTNGHEDAAKKGDLGVIIQPWNKVSLRSDEETFPYCAQIASFVGGGGHPAAAGCSTDILGKYGDVSYEEHWETQGAAVKEILLDSIEEVLQDINDESESADDETDDGEAEQQNEQTALDDVTA